MSMLSVMPADNIDRASHYIAFARAYAGAARRVLATEIAGNERLPYFALVAHGLELALKAILTRAGWDEERLMMIGHDLERCYVAVSRYRADLAVIPGIDVAGVIEALAYPHAIQSFRYPQAEPRNLPDASIALDCLDQILDVAGRA